MTATKNQLSMRDITNEIEKAYLASDDHPSLWHAVRVGIDGTVYTSEEASRCESEAEYFGRKPHPVTVWSRQGGERSGPGDGFRYWEPCEESEAEFFTDGGDGYSIEKDDEHTEPHMLGGIVDFELDDAVEAEIREKLEACDWLEVVD